MNKRQIKKAIYSLCGDYAGNCLFIADCVEGVDDRAVADIIVKIAQLQTSSVEKVSVSFDKSPKDFENAHEYRKARRKYYKAATAALKKEFREKLEEIVKEMNATMPKADEVK